MKDTISIHIVGISHIDKSTAYIRNSHYIPIRDRPLLTVLWGHAMSALASFKEVRPTGGLLYQWRDKPQKWWFIMGYVGDPTDINDVKWYKSLYHIYIPIISPYICWWFLYWCYEEVPNFVGRLLRMFPLQTIRVCEFDMDIQPLTTLWQTYKKLLKMAIYSEFYPWKMVIFHSYVSLPEGNHDLGLSENRINQIPK